MGQALSGMVTHCRTLGLPGSALQLQIAIGFFAAKRAQDAAPPRKPSTTNKPPYDPTKSGFSDVNNDRKRDAAAGPTDRSFAVFLGTRATQSGPSLRRASTSLE